MLNKTKIMSSMPYLKKRTAACLFMSAVLTMSTVQAAELMVADSKPLSQFWLNPGMLSYHYQRDKNLNDFNPGLGIEYRFSTTSSVTAGFFYNSDREYSRYAGIFWQPLTFGRARLGVVAGGFDGYPNAFNGGWFPAVIPAAAFESERMGMNFFLIPAYKDRLYGALSFQFKYKFHEQ